MRLSLNRPTGSSGPNNQQRTKVTPWIFEQRYTVAIPQMAAMWETKSEIQYSIVVFCCGFAPR